MTYTISRIISILTLGFLLALLLCLSRCAIWRSPKPYSRFNACPDSYSVLTMTAYGELAEMHSRPYVYRKTLGGGEVLVYGAEHTKDPDDKQIADIASRWEAFKPDVALVEGRLGFLLRPFMHPVKEYGESGWVAALAKRDDVVLYSWEPSVDAVNRALESRYTPEQLALGRILNPYFSNLRFGKPASPEAYVTDVLDRATEFGVQDKFKSVDDVDRYWRQYFPAGPDWRDVSDQWGLPGYLGEISDERNRIRNAHLACIVIDMTNRGERVLVIAGSSHAVCIEPALTDGLR